MKVGNGEYAYSQKQGMKKMMIIGSNGEKIPVTLTNILYVPEMWCNLFSTTAAMNEGCDDIGKAKDKKIIILEGTFQLVFNQQF